MTLTLVDPPTGSIEQRASGLIVIKCEDYIGPARGTLSTVADANSANGTVVKDEQALAVATTFVSMSSRFSSASDTLRIPYADLAPFVGTTDGFIAMAGLKVEGDVPTNARAHKTAVKYDADGRSAGIAFGRDSTFLSAPDIWTSFFGDQYKLTYTSLISWGSISSGTNFTVRAWGITGGDIAMYLDLIYLVPREFGDGLDRLIGPGGFLPFIPGTNGTLLVDDDNNTSNVIGQFSVSVYHGTYSMTDFSSGVSDMQEANDEVTLYDINGSGDWDGSDPLFNPLDPKSWLLAAVGQEWAPEQTLITDDFSANSPAPPVNNHLITGPDGYVKFNSIGNGFNTHTNGYEGWNQGGGSLRCSLGANSPGAPGTFPHADWAYGVYQHAFGAAPADPRDWFHTLRGMEDTIQTFKVSFDALADVRVMCGIGGFEIGTPAIADRLYGVALKLSSGGALTGELVTYNLGDTTAVGGDQSKEVSFDGPVTIDASYSAGDDYWVKIERRRYRQRVKFWADGGSEPAGWDLDGYEPLAYRKSTSGAGVIDGYIQYPYDTNWVGNTDHDVVVLGPWVTDMGWYPVMQTVPLASTFPEFNFLVDDYTLTTDPVGADPEEVEVEQEKWDGSQQWGSAVVPAGALRIVEGDLRKRNFNADTNGFNLRAWKTSTAPELQSALIAWAWQRGVLGEWLPHIYRLVIF
jgi:hypothetical protein